jgi:preprotein translocase subunit Sec61beta
MLTKFHSRSSFKKKFTVVVIWLIAFAMMAGMVKFISETKINFLWLTPLIILALFTMIGILLRCRIARWFALLTIYSLTLSPLVGYVMLGDILPIPAILTYVILLFTGIYVFSNKKAIEIFYIDFHPYEHLPLILLALTINSLYIYVVRVI